MLDKTFTPAEMEARLYAEWEARGFFKPGRKPKAEPYTIVIPPPNVTGSLHMGHALNNTIQDILIRFERMRGLASVVACFQFLYLLMAPCVQQVCACDRGRQEIER